MRTKRITVTMIILLGAMLCTSVQAQLVLGLNTSGTVKNNTFVTSPAITMGMNHSRISLHSWKSTWRSYSENETWRGIMEFNLTTVSHNRTLPTASMQSSNWSAWIEGLVVDEAVGAGLGLTMRVFDLMDVWEDGIINTSDYNGSTDFIETLFTQTPYGNTVLSNVDVTSALRRDLFGSGQGEETTGFIFIPSGSFYNSRSQVSIDSGLPRLIINVFTPTPIPTVTPVPTSTPEFECEIEMPSDAFYPYDICWTHLWITNNTGEVFWETPVFVVLDFYGNYYFAPSFTDFDYYTHPVFPGRFSMVVLPEFEWPDGVGEAEDIRWWAAITDPDITELLSEMDQFSFSWYEE